MALEGLLTIIGLIIAVFALGQPVQRRSIPLLVPVWFILLTVAISMGLSMWRIALPVLGYDFLPWSDLASAFGAFLFPVLGIVLGYFYWHNGKLRKKKDKKFRRFILASLYDDRFDELIRIVQNNEESIFKISEPETLDLLFDRRFIRRMVAARNWIHLRLFSNNSLVEKLPDRFRVRDNIIREFFDIGATPLHAAVAAKYGGSEYLRPTSEEWQLLRQTFQNPGWYMSVRIDYSLTVLACCEALASRSYDEAYNQNDEWYIATQGESTRLKCPIYLALKTHVIMLSKAIEIEGEEDYYVSDLWEIFRDVCKHSKFDSGVWESRDANLEHPTPFAYLIKEILLDLRELCQETRMRGGSIRAPGRLGSGLIKTWASCAAYLGYSEDRVSDRFLSECLGYYLDYVLQIKEDYETTKDEAKENHGLWCAQFVEELLKHKAGEEKLKGFLIQAMQQLDVGKIYVFNHKDWLKNGLGL